LFSWYWCVIVGHQCLSFLLFCWYWCVIVDHQCLSFLLFCWYWCVITITHQYQQNEQSPLNSDGQQLHTNINKTKESLNIDGQQLHTNINWTKESLNIDHQCLSFLLFCWYWCVIVDHQCLNFLFIVHILILDVILTPLVCICCLWMVLMRWTHDLPHLRRACQPLHHRCGSTSSNWHKISEKVK
jgi:hypothetical protein